MLLLLKCCRDLNFATLFTILLLQIDQYFRIFLFRRRNEYLVSFFTGGQKEGLLVGVTYTIRKKAK